MNTHQYERERLVLQIYQIDARILRAESAKLIARLELVRERLLDDLEAIVAADENEKENNR